MKLRNFSSNNRGEIIRECVRYLEADRIIAYPTETLYGIGGNAYSESVWQTIYHIKGINSPKPFLLLIKDIPMVEKITGTLDSCLKTFLENIWPGNVSVIIPLVQPFMGFRTIGFRISHHPFVTMLFEYITFPLISTSLNITGEKPVTSLKDIPPEFLEKLDLIIESDVPPAGHPSTIIQVNPDTLLCVREGIVPFDRLMGIYQKMCSIEEEKPR